MYIGHAPLCLSVLRRIPTLPHEPGWNLGAWLGCPIVWVDLQSLHGFRCYDDIAPNAKYQRVLCTRCLVASCGTTPVSLSRFFNRHFPELWHFHDCCHIHWHL